MNMHNGNTTKRQQTESKKLLELVKQGNPNAIAALINQSLQPQGIVATAKLTRNCLYVFVESSQVPNQQAVVAFIRKQLIGLSVESIKTVKVYGRRLGENLAAWTHEFELHGQIDPKPVSSKPSSSASSNSSQSKKETLGLDKQGNLAQKNQNYSSRLSIKDKAGSELSSNQNRNLERILLIITTFLLTSITWLRLGSLQSFKLADIPLIPSLLNSLVQQKTTISGAAWVTKQSGNSDIVRGLEIVLCGENVKSELMRVREEKWRQNLNKFKNKSGFLNLNIHAMNQKVASHKDCTKIVKTDVEGKYNISDVTLGSYFLYAPFETSFFKAYWIIPFKVESAKPLHIDLDNSNMAEIYNKE